MVTAELNASMIKDPFLVFTGTKMEDAKTVASRLQTNDFKHSTWRDDELGKSFVNFQKKHWSDEDASIRCLKALVCKMHP